jgi:phage recombination protein Bet
MELPKEKVELIKKTVAKDANDLELQMFLHLCNQYKLDPFLKEIYFMKRKVYNSYKQGYDEVPTMMVSRDGFLAIAHKSGAFDGMDTEAIYDDKGNLVGARCTVYNKSFAHPVSQSVLFKEYCVYTKDGKAQGLWSTKPETMIKKVAEAQALRKAFNVHGVYMPEEMEAEIARDNMRDIDNISETLALAEQVHGKDAVVPYAEWAEKVMTAILDALSSAKTEQDVKDIKHNKDILNLNEEDRKYIQEMIDNAWQEIVTGQREPLSEEEEDEVIAEPLKESKSPRKSSGNALQGDLLGSEGSARAAVPSTKSAPQSDIGKGTLEKLAEQEAFGKEWLPKAVKEIQACDTKAKLTLWKSANIAQVMNLITEHRDYIKAMFQTQFDKVKDS